MNEVQVERKHAICKKCNYSWKTKSKLFYIICPSCHASNKRTESIVEEMNNG